MNKNMILNAGGIVAVGAIVFGGGLLALNAFSSGTSAHVATSEGHDDQEKKDGHEGGDGHESGKAAEGHGEKPAEGHEAKADSHGGHEEKHGDSHEAKTDSHDKKDSHDSHKAKGGHGHGGEAESGGEEKQGPTEDDKDDLKAMQKKFEDLIARSKPDEARGVALKASALAGAGNHAWQLRLADVTFQTEALPSQQRYEKSYDIYARLLTQNSEDYKPEWVRYRVALCLKNLGRWEDAMQAAELFLKTYPSSARRHEMRLLYAQALNGFGHADDARVELDKILNDDAPGDLRAAALVEVGNLELKRSKSPEVTAQANLPKVQPLSHTNPAVQPEIKPVKNEAPKNDVVEVVDLAEHSPQAPAVPADIKFPIKKRPPEPLVPESQWEVIRRAVTVGKMDEAHRLLRPWIDPTSPLTLDQKAQVSLEFAKLIREIASASESLERRH